jgi:hypothetical protein
VASELDAAALWWSLPDEVRSHARQLMITKHPYEAMRVLVEATGSAPKARRMVAWLAQMMIKEAGK